MTQINRAARLGGHDPALDALATKVAVEHRLHNACALRTKRAMVTDA